MLFRSSGAEPVAHGVVGSLVRAVAHAHGVVGSLVRSHVHAVAHALVRLLVEPHARRVPEPLALAVAHVE